MTDQPLTIADVEALLLAANPPEPEPDPFPGDPTATWTYWSDMDTAERGVPEEWVWERLRMRRNAHLAASDTRVGTDAPGDVDAWKAHRQALRDLPANTTDPRLVVWPDPPTSTDKNPNRATIERQARDALQRNRDFIASTPTNATTVAAVKDHARQLNGIIRLLLGALDDVT